MWWWKQKIHSSWVVAIVSAGFVVGVAVSPLMPRVHWLVACAGLAGVVVSFVILRYYVVAPAALAGVLFGASYGSAHLVQRSVYEQFIGKNIQVRGRVREDPARSSSGALSLQIDRVSINHVAMPGALFVSARSVREVKRGDIVEAKGDARAGFANFPLSVSVMALGTVTRAPTADIGRVARDWFADKVRVVIPEPQVSLGIGFLTGQKSALPPELADALKIAGLTHIVVASGYNLTILVQMARKLLLRASKFLAAVSSSVMVLAFMAVTGLSPSMTRAGLVSGMSLLAWYYGHGFHPFVLLPFAAALTVAFQPSYVWGDLGWQLSFAAFAGVMIVAPLLHHYFFGEKEPGMIRQLLGETIAAHLVTVPVIALSFGVISNVAIIANVLVVPLVPLAMLLTFVCGVGVMLSMPFVQYIALPTNWLLEYMVKVAEVVADIPWAQSELPLPPLVWAGYALALGAACLWMWRQTHHRFRGVSVDESERFRERDRQTCRR